MSWIWGGHFLSVTADDNDDDDDNGDESRNWFISKFEYYDFYEDNCMNAFQCREILRDFKNLKLSGTLQLTSLHGAFLGIDCSFT